MNLPIVPLGVTLVFAALLVGLILCLALEEKIHAKKSIIAVVFALISLFLANVFRLYEYVDHKFLIRLPPFDSAHGHTAELPVYIPAIDWGVIALIFFEGIELRVLAAETGEALYEALRGDAPPVFYGVSTDGALLWHADSRAEIRVHETATGNVARTMDRVHEVLPGAQRRSIPRCGHFLQEDRPNEVAQALGDFFAS